MSIVSQRLAIAANAQSDALAGTEFEFSPPAGAMYNVAAVYSAEVSGGIIVMDVFFGSVQKASTVALRRTSVTASPGDLVTPDVSQDLKLSERAPGGVKIRVVFREIGGQACNVMPLIEIK